MTQKYGALRYGKYSLGGRETTCHKRWPGKLCTGWKDGPDNLKESLTFFEFLNIPRRRYKRDETWAMPYVNHLMYFSSWPAHSSTERERNWNPNLTTTAWISLKWSGKTELKSWVGKVGEWGVGLALQPAHGPAAWLWALRSHYASQWRLPSSNPEAIPIMGNSSNDEKNITVSS